MKFSYEEKETHLRLQRKIELASQVEEFYNHHHGKGGLFAPTSGGNSGGKGSGKASSKKESGVSGKSIKNIRKGINDIGTLGPKYRYGKTDLKKLSDPELRRLHKHLETNSKKWGAVLTGVTIAATLIASATIGTPFLGSAVSTVTGAVVTRAKERFLVGREAQVRGISLGVESPSIIFSSPTEFQDKTPKEAQEFIPDVTKMSRPAKVGALKAGLKAINDLLDSPDELTGEEQKALKILQETIQKLLDAGI